MKYQRLYYYFQGALSSFLCDEIIAQGLVNNPDIALTGNAQKPRRKKQLSQVKRKILWKIL